MDSRSSRTKRALGDSLKELMCEQKFEKLSVEQICSKAEVNRRNFYRHFLDKYDLLGWVYEQDFNYDFDEHPDWTIIDYFPLFCQTLYDNKEFYIRAYQVSGQNGFREYCYNWLYPLLHRTPFITAESPEMEHRLFKVVTYATFDAFIDWLKSDKSMIVIVLLFLWKNLGYNMILFLSALNNIPKDLIEVADLEGASPMWRMVHIKFRYLSPTFMFVTIMSLINSFKLFREVYLLTGDYPHENLFMLQHFMNNTFRTLDYQKLSSAALVMAAVMVLIIGVLFTIESIFGRDVEG